MRHMDNFKALVLLNMVKDIGSVRTKKLIEAFKEPCLIFKASLSRLAAVERMSAQIARGILEARERIDVDKEIKKAEDLGVRILTLFDDDYPKNLKEIYDPPYVLYVKGDFIDADENAVGIVGSRGASYYGLSCAQSFASKLSSFGLTIVSGMARGIDTASHRAALNAGGRTIAVLGSGLNNIYPPENEGLFAEIAQHGAVISQFSLDTPPAACNFPIRNRIISGLSRGVLVVEASSKSGALITARYALEQDREVFAVPGKVSSPTSSGTNDLIKQGARIVTEPEEILAELKANLKLNPAQARSCGDQEKEDGILNSLDTKESRVFRILSDEPKYIDSICLETGLDVSACLFLLTQLELRGIVRQLPGKVFVKTYTPPN